ncbi:ABC transporter ATP-binding protein [Aerococcus sp. Group 1]|uniref:ABC transporter ATP-binding protein n=1 Tax=Aerococcus urinae (strain CCUG 59500 / ACS-120-V-Col10a) TaxID=2976812 RepID=UPI00227B4A65|nr:ATP-binding cassette domain-containing protein [Aerococcus sp. Group 1]MCY3030534.1 ATP-binding cassette domain-containing protein [Aerococcus sp. Group 1]
MNELVQLKNLNKVFQTQSSKPHQVIKNLNFSIKDNDFISVIGSNGAGKSTMMNLIAGTIPLSSGQIYLEDREISALPAYKRAKMISRVFQDPQMGTAKSLSVEENLAIAYKRGHKRSFQISITKDMREEFRARLSTLAMGLENRMQERVSYLSGGQRQVLTLLMAVLQTPKLLLLDEHTAALDPRTSAMVMSLTQDLVSEYQLTTLMITHDMNDALAYGNRLIMLHDGQVVVDISGEEKENCSIDDLLQLFHHNVGESLNNDELLLAN